MLPVTSRSSRPHAPAAKASALARSASAGSRVRARSRANWLLLPAMLLVVPLAPGCYLSHVAAGQLELLSSTTPIEALLHDPSTPEATRAGLDLVLRARRFATSLGLEVDGQYTHYAEWPGDRLVTTVVATRPGELDPVGFWFPIVGRVPYKGFFEPARAEDEADTLRADGFDVCLSPVRAYSTLGWFADPITGPMLRQTPGRLVETVIHELVHANVYAPNHASFNESIATFIGEEGRVAFFARHEGEVAGRRERARVRASRAYRALLEQTRSELAALYTEGAAEPALASRRARLLAATRGRIQALSGLENPGAAAREARLNDACLALAGTYSAHLERYAVLVSERGLDLPSLIEQARRAASSPEPLTALGL